MDQIRSDYSQRRYAGYLNKPTYWREHIASNVFRHIAEAPNGAALDVGCGVGHGTRELAARFSKVMAVDTDVEQIRVAELNRSKGCDFYYAPDTLLWLRSQAATFDLILADNVLEHIPTDDLGETLVVVRHLLSSAGYLVIVTPNAASSIGAFLRYDDYTHLASFTQNSLRDRLELSGFVDIRFPRYFVPGNVLRRSILRLEAGAQSLRLRAFGYDNIRCEAALVAVARRCGDASTV